MRLTLEQLNAMSKDEVMQLWRTTQFPFDFADCGMCLTMHERLGCDSHPQIAELVKSIRGNDASVREAITTHFEEFYAMRLFFDSVYPQPALESDNGWMRETVED